MAEGDLGERRAVAGVADDVGDDALEVPVALAEVEGAEAPLRWWVWDLNMDPAPLRCARITRPIFSGGGGAAAAGGATREWALCG
jgi:hypothetical protein